MRFVLLVAMTAIFSIQASNSIAQPPLPEWRLSQNNPNPFCNKSTAPDIGYALAQPSFVALNVWSPDTTYVVRSILNMYQSAGSYMVRWDGRDNSGELVTQGDYPYSLTAYEEEGGPILFEDMLVASVRCEPTSNEAATWGRIKSLFK